MTTQEIEAALVELAGQYGGDYASFHHYEREDGTVFYGVNVHRGYLCKSTTGDTMAEALGKLGDKAWFDATPDQAEAA